MEKSNGKKINTAVFISGRGSNLKHLIKYSKKKSSISIRLVVSNNLKAKGPLGELELVVKETVDIEIKDKIIK